MLACCVDRCDLALVLAEFYDWLTYSSCRKECGMSMSRCSSEYSCLPVICQALPLQLVFTGDVQCELEAAAWLEKYLRQGFSGGAKPYFPSSRFPS